VLLRRAVANKPAVASTPPTQAATRPGDDPAGRDEDVQVQAGPVALSGRLTLPKGARSVVIFAHGSGSSRHSPRNQFVAAVLSQADLGTLLFDLLTPEEYDRANVSTSSSSRDASSTRLCGCAPSRGWPRCPSGTSERALARVQRCGPLPHPTVCDRRGVPRRAAGPRRSTAPGRAHTDASHRGWARRRGARVEP
jgi:hypothetical protein